MLMTNQMTYNLIENQITYLQRIKAQAPSDTSGTPDVRKQHRNDLEVMRDKSISNPQFYMQPTVRTNENE